MKSWNQIKKDIKRKVALSLKAELQDPDTINNESFSKFKSIGLNSSFEGTNHFISGFDNFEIGENVHIGENSYCISEGGIEIGDNTVIGRNVVITSSNPDYKGNLLPFDGCVIKNKVVIGKNVWIGMNVCITPGTTIGDGCIIEMGTTVSGNIPALSIVGPAKYMVISQRNADHYYHLENEKMYGGINGKLYNRSTSENLYEIGDTYKSRRSKSELILFNGRKAVKKTYLNTSEGRAAYDRESAAYSKFENYHWRPKLLELDKNSITIEYFPAETRLDKVINPSPELLEEVLWSLLDIFNEGFAHCDFHARNIFITANGIKIIDFETVTPQENLNFFESYDVTGKGLISPLLTNNMCIFRPTEPSLSKLFKIKDVEELRRLINNRFKKQMLSSSITFQSLKRDKGRHNLQTQNIYSSFDLKNIEIKPQDSQRDTNNRLANFGIDLEVIQNKSILDIGSNVGGTLLGLARYNPKKMVGIEFDKDKVSISNKLARYNEILNVEFVQMDIENSKFIEQLGEKFDIVFCLAVIEHLKNKKALFDILNKVCKSTLYFEGNSGSDIEFIINGLKNSGFKQVQYLGFSNDEKRISNNVRPLFIAKK